MRWWLGLAVLALQAGAAAGAPMLAPAGGEVRALVVGIDDYLLERRLKGAVADARDLEAALRRAGVTNLDVLIDAEATRPRLIAAMGRLIDQTRANDLVIISFAGHGTQRPESVRGSKPDGLDEAFVLHDFDRTSTKRNPDLVIGPEMRHWLGQLEAKGAEAVFIADTCHGGGLSREADPRAAELSYRASAIGAAAAAELDLVSQPADAYRDENTFKRVTFLAAVDRNSKAPEVDIPGQPTKRGALSYAVARAIEGSATRVDRGVSRNDLFAYARQVVSQYAQEKQTIVTEPTRGAGTLDRVVWRSLSAAGRTQDAETAGPAPANVTPVRVAVLDGDPSALAGVKPIFTPFVVTSTASDAELSWDVRNKEAIVATDVVARGIEASDVPAVVDRVRALSELAAMSERRPQTIELKPSNALHHRREMLTFEARDLGSRYPVIFNIAGDGRVQFLYPLGNDAQRVSDAVWQIKVDVREPFGADTVVAVVSDQPLTALGSELKSLDGRRAAGRVPQLVRQLLPPGATTRIGFASLFTAP
jgi:hypothetical protein